MMGFLLLRAVFCRKSIYRVTTFGVGAFLSIILFLVYFEWNQTASSKSMSFEKSLTSSVGSGFDRDSWRSESLTRVKITNGTGFKSVVGNAVLAPGGKYYFVVRILKGSLIKIGITRSQENNEVVSL